MAQAEGWGRSLLEKVAWFSMGAAVGALAVLAVKRATGWDPPQDLVEAVARSEWARAWAAKFCGGEGKAREECIERVSRMLAQTLISRMAQSLYSE